MIVGQVSQMLIGISDSAFIGRVGTVELAAAAFTHGVFGLVYVVGIGFLMPVAVLTARDHGAGTADGGAVWLRHGKALALVVGAAAFALLAVVSTGLDRFGQPAEVVAVMRPYFLLTSLSLLPVFYFQVQRQYLDALGKPWVGTGIMIADVALNALLNWMFIWGHLGAPALGLTGSGVATLLARLAAVGAITFWLPRLGTAEPGADVSLRCERFRAMLAIGVPAAVSLLFESGLFASVMVMMGWLGTTALAAHQIALGCVALTFMMPLGLSLAVSIRIGRARGEGRGDLVRAIGFGALGCAGAASLVFAAVFLCAGSLLARGFTADPAVIVLAVQLLAVGAMFQLFDGAQVVAAGALRGLEDVKVPTAITFAAYWMVALPTAWALAFVAGNGAVGLWAGLAVGLGAAALALADRFRRLTR